MGYDDQSSTQGVRISPRILRHILSESTDLLEEAQTHAVVEKLTDCTANTLSQTNWQLTATCLWAIDGLFPSTEEREPAAHLHAPIPLFVRGDHTLSPQLANFVERVNRLHDRARRLDDLSQGPVVSTEQEITMTPATLPVKASEPVETREPATIIPLFGAEGPTAPPANLTNPITEAHSQVRWAMAGLE